MLTIVQIFKLVSFTFMFFSMMIVNCYFLTNIYYFLVAIANATGHASLRIIEASIHHWSSRSISWALLSYWSRGVVSRRYKSWRTRLVSGRNDITCSRLNDFSILWTHNRNCFIHLFRRIFSYPWLIQTIRRNTLSCTFFYGNNNW